MLRKFYKDNINYFICKYTPICLREIILKIAYKKKMKQSLNLKNPKTYSEKIQYIKLYEKNDKKRINTDKLAVKEKIKEIAPELKVAKVYQVGKKFEDINFNKLPNSFVIKTNHYCGSNFLVKDKNKLTPFRLNVLKKYYNTILKRNFAYEAYFEMQYKNIEPLIFVEEYISDSEYKIPIEYKVNCFNSEPKFIVINYSTPRDASIYFYDKDFEQFVPKQYRFNKEKDEINIDFKLEETYKITKKLCKDYNTVRVDLYNINGNIYFGEMTFTPQSGFFNRMSYEFNIFLGKYIPQLDKNNKE